MSYSKIRNYFIRYAFFCCTVLSLATSLQASSDDDESPEKQLKTYIENGNFEDFTQLLNDNKKINLNKDKKLIKLAYKNSDDQKCYLKELLGYQPENDFDDDSDDFNDNFDYSIYKLNLGGYKEKNEPDSLKIIQIYDVFISALSEARNGRETDKSKYTNLVNMFLTYKPIPNDYELNLGGYVTSEVDYSQKEKVDKKLIAIFNQAVTVDAISSQETDKSKHTNFIGMFLDYNPTKNKYQPNLGGNKGYNSVKCAIENNYLEGVRKLIEYNPKGDDYKDYKVDVNSKSNDEHDETLLHVALRQYKKNFSKDTSKAISISIIRLLIAKGVKIDVLNSKRKMAFDLLSHDEQKGLPDDLRKTFLGSKLKKAIEEINFDDIKNVLDKNPNFSIENKTKLQVLGLAIKEGSHDMVTFLLTKYPNIANDREDNREYPLLQAVSQPIILELFLKHKNIDLKVTTKNENNGLLHLISKTLTKFKKNPDKDNNEQKAKKLQSILTDVLKNKKIDPTLRNSEGKMASELTEDSEIVEELQQAEKAYIIKKSKDEKSKDQNTTNSQDSNDNSDSSSSFGDIGKILLIVGIGLVGISMAFLYWLWPAYKKKKKDKKEAKLKK